MVLELALKQLKNNQLSLLILCQWYLQLLAVNFLVFNWKFKKWDINQIVENLGFLIEGSRGVVVKQLVWQTRDERRCEFKSRVRWGMFQMMGNTRKSNIFCKIYEIQCQLAAKKIVKCTAFSTNQNIYQRELLHLFSSNFWHHLGCKIYKYNLCTTRIGKRYNSTTNGTGTRI